MDNHFTREVEVMKKGYLCESCGKFSESVGPYIDGVTEIKPWKCPVCKKDACQHCYYKYATHFECCQGKTDEEIIEIADSNGFNFKDR